MTPTLRERERKRKRERERERERIEPVTLLLAGEFGIIPSAVEAGPTGTVTHHCLATGQDDEQRFVKTYPQGADARAAEAAVELGAYARLYPVPVPAALPTVGADRFVASCRGLLLSVIRFVSNAVTADERITGALWEAVGQTVGRLPPAACRLHRGSARHPHRSPPSLGARDKAIGLGRNVARLEESAARCRAAVGLRERLHEAEEVLRAHLA
ncbi:hypothetical protein ABTX77_41720 [Streptomyces sp. NPDC097704]|uniref:hypothetical protein n=1 Tax=Streptomyces sp. NPDC097704 TaxID=3157101 RepID=UPI00331AE7FD